MPVLGFLLSLADRVFGVLMVRAVGTTGSDPGDVVPLVIVVADDWLPLAMLGTCQVYNPLAAILESDENDVVGALVGQRREWRVGQLTAYENARVLDLDIDFFDFCGVAC